MIGEGQHRGKCFIEGDKRTFGGCFELMVILRRSSADFLMVEGHFQDCDTSRTGFHFEECGHLATIRFDRNGKHNRKIEDILAPGAIPDRLLQKSTKLLGDIIFQCGGE